MVLYLICCTYSLLRTDSTLQICIVCLLHVRLALAAVVAAAADVVD